MRSGEPSPEEPVPVSPPESGRATMTVVLRLRSRFASAFMVKLVPVATTATITPAAGM